MNVFVDANILVSVINKEFPLFMYSSRILSLAGSLEYKIFTSPICLAIAFYFAEKKFKRNTARRKIALLCNHILITNTGNKEVQQTIANAAIQDFEDGLEYYAAKASNCQCIITENIKDFYFSEIEVLDSLNLFTKYIAKK